MEAIEILRLSTELQTGFIRKLSCNSELADFMAAIVDRTTELVQASAVSVFTVDPDLRRAVQQAGSGYQRQFNGMGDVAVVPAREVPELPKPGEELGITGWLLSTGKPLMALTHGELAAHPHYRKRPQPDEEIQIQTFIGIPIRGLNGQTIGVLKAERRLEDANVPAGPFSVQDELAAETMARISGRCITYLAMARSDHEDDAITGWARDVIGEALGTEAELDRFLDTVARVTAAAVGADSCGIFLRDESEKTLTQRAGVGSHALRYVIRAYEWPNPEAVRQCMGVSRCKPPECPSRRDIAPSQKVGLTAWIAATGKSFHARNREELSRHCHHLGSYDQWNFASGKKCGAFLGVPLLVAGRVIGVVKVENISDSVNPSCPDFSAHEERRLEILAQDMALATTRLHALIPTRYGIINDAQTALFDILRGGLEIPDLVHEVVERTRKLFHASACALFLRDGDRLIQPQWAASGWAQRGPEVREYKLVAPGEIADEPAPGQRVGLTVWIAAKQTPFKAQSNVELRRHPHHKGTFDEHNFRGETELERCESFMGFPLLIKRRREDELIGVLKVESKTKGEGPEKEYTYFNELDELVFELIASGVAIAIQNARLLESREAALRKASQSAAHRLRNILPPVSGYLSSIEASEMTDDAREAVRIALEQTRRAQRILADFESFARAERFDRPEIVDAEALVLSLAEEVRGSLKQSGCPVTTGVAPGAPGVRVNLDRLKDDFVAFARDSERHKPSGLSLRITAETATDDEVALLDLPAGRRYLKLVYADNGPGISANLKSQIFEPFFSTSGGSGLGLSIAAHTARGHGGRIIESGEPGKGVRFELLLPER